MLDRLFYRDSYSIAASEFKGTFGFTLQDAIEGLAVKMVVHERRDAAFETMMDELDRLLVLRFDDYELADYGGEVVYAVAADAYHAGFHAGVALCSDPEKKAEWDHLQHEQGRVLVDLELARSQKARLEAEKDGPQGLHASELAAIAVSDHDCPGAHG